MKKKTYIIILISFIIAIFTIVSILNNRSLSVEDAIALYEDDNMTLTSRDKSGKVINKSLVIVIIKELVSHDINATEKYNGASPLIMASGCGYTKLVKALIKAGANIKAKDNQGNSALMTATKNAPQIYSPALEWTLNISSNDRKSTIKQLIEAGADIEAKDSMNNTSLTFAAINNNSDVIKILIDNGANLDVQNNYGFTPLMIVAKERRAKTTKIFIDAGANLDIKNNQNQTALMLATEAGHTEIVNLLKAAVSK